MKRHLAVDIGSESGRVYMGYIQEGKVYTEEIYRFKTQFMQAHGKSMRNIYRFHEEIIHGMQEYAEKYGSTLDSIGVDSWGSDFVLLDRKGHICALPVSYRGMPSAKKEEQYIEEKFGLKKLYMRTGNQAMPPDTINQLVRMIMNQDSCMDDPHAILFMGDLYQYLLGADPCCEHSLVSYCRFYNNLFFDWDDEVMDALGIPQNIKTKIVYAGDIIGTVDAAILKEVGLDEGVKIITPCTHDTACAALAIPDMGEDWMFISSGTWSLIGTETDGPVINEISCKYNMSNSTMPLKTNMLKKNIQGMWVIQQCRKAWGNKHSYPEIVEAAQKAPELNVFIDVDMEEFFAPDNMAIAVAEAVKRDFGVDVDWKDIGSIARICYESLALKYRYYAEKILQAANKKVSKIYIVGGGSKNALLNQFTANATGYTVCTGVTEGSSIANILLQAYGAGELKDKQEMRQVICNTFEVQTFEAQDEAVWNEKYRIFETQISHKAQY